MNIKFKKLSENILLVVKDEADPVITDTGSALDMIATARYEHGM